eukprot:1593121-Rhodomonas_salina.1
MTLSEDSKPERLPDAVRNGVLKKGASAVLSINVCSESLLIAKMRYRDTGSHLGRYPYSYLGTKAGVLASTNGTTAGNTKPLTAKNQPFITQICTDREAVVMGCGASKVKKLDFYEVQSVSPVSNQALQFVEENNQEGCDFDEASHGVHASVVRELMESYKRDALAKMTTAQFSEK